MNGAEVRTRRLFDRESGRSFMAAFDHGLVTRVPDAVNALRIVEKVIDGGPDGVLVSPGMLERSGHLFAFRGAPAPIVRSDFMFMDESLEELGDQYRVLLTPKDAAGLGAEGMVMYLVLGVDKGDVFVENVRSIANTTRKAHQLGLPVIVETVLWGSRVSDSRDPNLLAYGCRMAAELGADIIKTEYTGDPKTFVPIVEGCPAPILTLGGPKVDSEEGLVEITQGAMEAGAKGVVYGRNIWQADDPARVSSAVREVVHGAYAKR